MSEVGLLWTNCDIYNTRRQTLARREEQLAMGILGTFVLRVVRLKLSELGLEL